MASARWFFLQVQTLCHDYERYNELLNMLHRRVEKPLQSSIHHVLLEEARLSRKIIGEERILQGWVETVPGLKRDFFDDLKGLQDLRSLSAKLRDGLQSTLKRGLTLVKQEQQKICVPLVFQSVKKDPAPRLIDITL
jgi:hypothetical protein